LNNPREDKIKKALIAFGGIDSIVMEEQSVQKLAKPFGEPILPKDKQDPSMLNARKSSQKIPQGKNRLLWEKVKVCLRPTDGIKIGNIKDKLPPRNKAPLYGDSMLGDYGAKLPHIGASDRLVVRVFKAQGPEFVGSGVYAIGWGIFGDEATPLNVKINPNKAPREEHKICIKEVPSRQFGQSFIAGIGDAIRPWGTIL